MKEPLINWNREDEGNSPNIPKKPAWSAWVALAFSVSAIVLYGALFILVPEYRQMIVGSIDQLPIFSRIVLNIYQPFLMVFILISMALMILFYLKLKLPHARYKAILTLIIVNCVFAVILFGVTRLGLG